VKPRPHGASFAPPPPGAARKAGGELARRASVGLTLLELLLVLFLLSLLMGLGAGALAGLDVDRRQALGVVKSTLRSAQNTAMARRATTRVRIDAAAGTLRPEVLAVVGTWHFEEPSLAGAFGLAGFVDGGDLVSDGFVGRGLSFARGAVDSQARFDVQDEPSFDLRGGFSISLALRREGAGAFRVLNLGNSAGADVLANGALRGWFFPEVAETDGEPRRGHYVAVESEPGALELSRWSTLELRYDREVLALRLDGVEVARRDETAPVYALTGPLTVSDDRSHFAGTLDNLVIRAVSTTEPVVLPPGTRFTSAPSDIFFDPGGALDRARHSEPVQFTLEHEDGSTEPIRIGRYGTVDA